MISFSTVLLSACVAVSPAGDGAPIDGAVAAEGAVEAPRVHDLKVNVPVDGAVTAGAAAAWILSESVAKHALAPDECRWCDRNAAGEDTLNALDRAGRSLRWGEGQKTADTLSNVGAFALVPLGVLGVDVLLAHQAGEVGLAVEDLLIIGETTAVALVLNQGVKFAVGRERPFVHALPPEERALTTQPDDNNLSFYSGHATFVFSIAVASGVVAEQRGYEKAWLAWAVGMPLAATTAYLRMGADKHYLTDVLTGAAIGSAFGVAVPLLFHPRVDGHSAAAKGPEVRVVPTGTGAALIGRF